jgi:N12 class adenine-specific DNA methylase
MAGKVGVVVPNHMLEQFTREWLQIYPEARLLAASTDTLAGDKRRLFVARAAANEWDAVILTQEAFKRLPVEPATQGRYIDREITLLEQALSDPELDRLSVKQIEKQLAAAQEKQSPARRRPRPRHHLRGHRHRLPDGRRVPHLQEPRHDLPIPDARIDGSLRSTDMAMKLAYLRDRHGARVVTVATATPIANSITEAHAMQRYLRPDLLREAGVEAFDAWAATFGVTTSEMEMAPKAAASA